MRAAGGGGGGTCATGGRAFGGRLLAAAVAGGLEAGAGAADVRGRAGLARAGLDGRAFRGEACADVVVDEARDRDAGELEPLVLIRLALPLLAAPVGAAAESDGISLIRRSPSFGAIECLGRPARFARDLALLCSSAPLSSRRQ